MTFYVKISRMYRTNHAKKKLGRECYTPEAIMHFGGDAKKTKNEMIQNSDDIMK